MKTIGMIGGMSWESSSVYYQQINREVQKRLGGVHSAKFLIYSFDFDEMATLQAEGRWAEANAMMVKVAHDLANAGADFLLIACNTMHCATSEMEKAVPLPLLHIADPLGKAIKTADLKRVGLVGSKYTMENDSVLRGRLRDRFGLDVIVFQACRPCRLQIHDGERFCAARPPARPLWPRCHRAGRRGCRRSQPRDLRGAGAREIPRTLAGPLPRHHRQTRRAGRARHHPRLHRTAATLEARRLRRADVRHHGAAHRRRRRFRAVLNLRARSAASAACGPELTPTALRPHPSRQGGDRIPPHADRTGSQV